MQTFVCDRGASAIVHIYPSVLQALAGQGYAGCLEGEHSERIEVWLCRILDMNFGGFLFHALG